MGRAARHLLALAALTLSAPLAGRAEAPLFGPLGRQPLPDGTERAQAGILRAGTMVHGPQGGPAARPDGTGKALAFYQLSLVDAYRSKGFSLMGDAFFLSGRRTAPAWAPTQASWLVGAAAENSGWRFEAAREDHRPLDEDTARAQAWRTSLRSAWGGNAQTRADARLPTGMTYMRPNRSPVLEGDWGVDWYFFNKTLPARSDRTGLAHLRYSLRGSLTGPKVPWTLVGSAEFLTAGSRWAAAELASSVGGGWRWKDGLLTVTREGRDVLDGPGYHSWWQATFSWSFAPPEGAL